MFISEFALLSGSSVFTGVGGSTAEHPATRPGFAGDQVEGHTPGVQPVLPRGEAGVVVALHRRPQRPDPGFHALSCLHSQRHGGGESLHVSYFKLLDRIFTFSHYACCSKEM